MLDVLGRDLIVTSDNATASLPLGRIREVRQ